MLRGEVWPGRAGGRQATAVHAARRGGLECRLGGAHLKHLVHVCDFRRVPAGYVRVEVLQVREDLAHVGDGRDVPVGDLAIFSNCGRLVLAKLRDRRFQ